MSTQESDVYTGVAKSMELYHQAGQLIPGATQLISRRPTLYAYGFSPAYAVSAKGARFTDVDGNEFVDWGSGIGAVILGWSISALANKFPNNMDGGREGRR